MADDFSQRAAQIPMLSPGYLASACGRIYLPNRRQGPTWSAGFRSTKGYMQVNTHGKQWMAHRLVAAAFLGESNLQVNHINGNKADNRIENLEYVTQAQNTRHAFETGLACGLKGNENPNSKKLESIRGLIEDKYEELQSYTKVAELLGLHRTTVERFLKGKTYHGR